MQEQSTTKSFAILSLAGIVAKLMSLLYVPILTRIIGDEGIGMYFKVYDIFVFIYAVTNVGMQTAISKYVAELSAVGNYKDAVRTFKISRAVLLVVGTLFTLIMMIGATSIAKFTGNPDIAYGLAFLSPAILTTSILATYKGYFQGRNRMQPVAIASVLEQFANVVISLVFAAILMKYGAQLGSAGGTLGTSVGAVIAVIYLVYIYYVFKPEEEADIKQGDSVKRVSSKKIIKILITYGLPITLSSGLQNFGNVIDMANVNSRLIHAGFTQERATELYGLLGKWRTLINIPMVFITSLCIAILPALSKARVLNDRQEMENKINFSLRITYFISIPSAFGLAVLAKEVYTSLYGKSDGYFMMVIGSITIILMAVVFVQNIILQSLNKFYFVVFTLVIGLVVKYFANYILVGNRKINVYGAVFGFILYFALVFILNNSEVRKVTKIKIKHINLAFKPILASIYMSVGIIALRWIVNIFVKTQKLGFLGILYTLFLVAFGGILYVQALLYMGAINKEDIRSLSPKVYNKIPNKIKRYMK